MRDIAVGGYYGTSALLHEAVELDILLEQDPKLSEAELTSEMSAEERYVTRPVYHAVREAGEPEESQ